MPTKKQGHRSQKLGRYYEAQFKVTERNKARRAAKRKRLASSPKALDRKVARLAKKEAKYQANLSKRGINTKQTSANQGDQANG